SPSSCPSSPANPIDRPPCMGGTVRSGLIQPPPFLAEGRKDRSGLDHVLSWVLPQRDEKLLLRLAGKTCPHLRQIPEYPLPRLEIPPGADRAVQDSVARRLPGDEVPAIRQVKEHDVDERR